MADITIKEKTDFVFDGTGTTAQTEALRHIRTNIAHVLPKKENGGANVVVFVSTTDTEGRSAVARRLSDIFANTGLKTLFIDCDLRKGGKPNGKGVSDHLSGGAGLSEVIHKGEGGGADIIYAGGPTASANELLSSPKFADMLKSLGTDYDYIFIDAPPLDNYPDGLAAVMLSDGVIAVTRQKRSSRVKLTDMLASLEFIKANILGFIMADYKR